MTYTQKLTDIKKAFSEKESLDGVICGECKKSPAYKKMADDKPRCRECYELTVDAVDKAIKLLYASQPI